MIQEQELRIGNKVLYNGEIDEVYSIFHINGQMQPYRVLLQGGRDKDGFCLLDIHPISLTSEILEKCAFKNGGSYWILNDVIIYDGELYGDFTYKYNYADKEIKYLHQLQNLYFALTGEELVYEP